MSPTIYNINNAILKNNMKIAGFDFDWTLVTPINGSTFPINIEDFEFYDPSVLSKLKQYHIDGYTIVIFTNQSKKWKHEQIKMACKIINIPIFIVIASIRADYKPNRILFDMLVRNYTIDKEESFFVGDALGEKYDFSDSDKLFAENIGIKYYSPEDIFIDKTKKIKIPKIPLSNKKEIIIMIGYPGSGKTTIAKHISKNNNYIHIAGDDYKSNSNKMRKVAIKYIEEDKSIIFDATHSNIKKRKEIIDFANKYNYLIKCIYVASSRLVSKKRNKLRKDIERVPSIAYSMYDKYYEEPNENEGFELYTIK
jgi:bifunctional polynucleotide phosphatase/kinase